MTTKHRETLITAEDSSVIAALRSGDEAAFVWLVGTYHSSFVRIARTHVQSAEVAEEVAQEAWLGILKGIDRFEGRSSLKTWIFRILINIARTRGVRERRCVPVSALAHDGQANCHEALLQNHASSVAVGWLDVTSPWEGLPQERVVASEIRSHITEAIDRLPPSQREVIILRDIEQLDSTESCALLDITPGNQRILLHRARASVRARLTEYLCGAS